MAEIDVPDLRREILSWLPVKILAAFRLVSPEWRATIDDPSFIRLQFTRSTAMLGEDAFLVVTNPRPRCNLMRISEGDERSFEALRNFGYLVSEGENPNLLSAWSHGAETKHWYIQASLDGIAVLGASNTTPTVQMIWNPCTTKFRRVAPMPDFLLELACRNFGLAYDDQSKDYKLVNFLQDGRMYGDTCRTSNFLKSFWTCNRGLQWVAVYSISTGVWSTNAFELEPWRNRFNLNAAAVSLNGTIYALTGHHLDQTDNIVAVDTKAVPPSFTFAPIVQLGVHGDSSLSLNEARTNLMLIEVSVAGAVKVWDLDNDIGNSVTDWTWTQRATFVLTQPPPHPRRRHRFELLTRDGLLLFQSSRRLTSYSLQTSEEIMFRNWDLGWQIWHYYENLTLVKGP